MKTLISQINKNTDEFLEAFDGLSSEQINWKPDSKTWSIGQNIDHLIIINRSYWPVIESVRNGTYKPPLIAHLGFMVSLFGKMILKAVQPDRKRKVKTFPIWEPSQSEIQEGILDRFKEHQQELKKMIENSRDLISQGVVISSPANRNIVYKLETAFEIMVTHERRHLAQAKEVLRLMNS